MVLVLMGIILSMTTLSVGDGGKYRRLEEEAQRLKTLMSMAKEEAILRSQEWAIAFKEDGYQFERENLGQRTKEKKKKKDDDDGTEEDKWSLIDDKIFRPRELAGYRLSVIIEDEEYTTAQDGENEDDIMGRVYIYSSGEMMPFELTIEQEEGEDHFVIKANEFGELDLKSSRDEEL